MKDKTKSKDLNKELEKLALAIDKVEDEKLIIENQLKKALADYHNLSNNVEKREELRFFQLKKNLCEKIIPSLDAITLALSSSKDINLDERGKAWLEGIFAILKNIETSFEGLGLKQYIPLKGDKFDSSIHEAVATVPNGTEGTVFDTVQPGYTLNDRVIRQARVVVSK